MGLLAQAREGTSMSEQRTEIVLPIMGCDRTITARLACATRPTKERLPITPATVEINGSTYSSRSTIWAGLRLHEALSGGDRLRVPWCHIDDESDGDGDAIYTLYPRVVGYRFVRAANGSWVMESERAK